MTGFLCLLTSFIPTNKESDSVELEGNGTRGDIRASFHLLGFHLLPECHAWILWKMLQHKQTSAILCGKEHTILYRTPLKTNRKIKLCLTPGSFDWHPSFPLVCMDKQYLPISWTDQQRTQHMRGNYFSPSIQTLLCTLSNYLLKAAWNVAWLRLAKLVLESDEWELRASVFTHQLSLSCWLPVQIFRRAFILF